MLMRILLVGLCWASLQVAAADSEGPTSENRFIVGVITHFLNAWHPANPDSAMQLIKDAHITAMRADAFWSVAEKTPGVLVMDPTWRAYREAALKQQLGMMLILGYGNEYYGNGAKPRSPNMQDRFVRYVDFIARSFVNDVDFYEIWNEWDVENPKDPIFTRDYVSLVEKSARQIRKRDPRAKVIAGAVTTLGIESGFVERMIDNGILESVDGLSLHPYVHCRRPAQTTPEAWIEWMRQVDQSITSRAGRPVPLYLTEMAWPAHRGPCGIDERQQAAYLVRSFLLARTLPSIKGMWWYDFKNDGTDKHEQEHNFGLLDNQFEPKPAYRTLASISRIVSDYTFEGRVTALNPDTYLLRFTYGNDEVLAAWTSGKNTQITLETERSDAGALDIIDTEQDGSTLIPTAQWQCPDAPSLPCATQLTIGPFPQLIRTQGGFPVNVR
ncbi:hypothetical protein IQ22_04335 [Pseudomonas duriflava]|uniref:Cellulase (Glycosyl hydrolase family 5) n=1 Tax=Pseudomonas duriflava TaxID=459528 RepID=A0A562PS32_9PSED|nr:hypothetical protein [Pseudomonas duriflava]TWI47271.1 hypothetical protein IQ22_04335 [Pseudomonas duriflava]